MRPKSLFTALALLSVASSGLSATKAELEEKFERYLILSRDAQDAYGYVHSRCDGLLFTSLYSLAGGFAEPMQSEAGGGQWFRHATHGCYPKHSKSTISIDMFQGLLLYLQARRDLAAVSRLKAYGEKHHWIMGQAANAKIEASRTRLPPELVDSIIALEDALKNGGHTKRPPPLAYWKQNLTNFRAHLQALSGLLWTKMQKPHPEFGAFLERQIQREPNNALFHALRHRYFAGPAQPAIDSLMNEQWFPSTRLPTANDRCTEYLFQRDQFRDGKPFKDWLPCPDKPSTHSGTDFLFAASFLLGREDRPLHRFSGVIVPMITPFKSKSTGTVDYAALKSFTQWLVERGVDGLFPISGMGEWERLKVTEKRRIIDAVLTAANGTPVYPGVGSPNNLGETIALCRYAEKRGSAGVIVATAPFISGKGAKPDQEKLFKYFGSVAENTTLPILIYDRKSEIADATLLRLTRYKNIVGLKMRHRSMDAALRTIKTIGTKMAVLTGREHNLSLALEAGARGVIGGGANLFPKRHRALIDAHMARKIGLSRKLNQELLDWNDVFGGTREIKYALKEFYALPIAWSNRKRVWKPITPRQRAAMSRLLK